jgi:tRNA pseudouridine38-40 synthase
MERNIKLVIAYDGTDFHGWQRQGDLRTVQHTVEQALQRVVRHPVDVVGASRTDSGVHAQGQVAHLITECSLPVGNLRRAVNQRLPDDAAVAHADVQPAGFHSTRDARSKLYRYRIHNDPARPVERMAARYVWHVWYELDTDRLRAAAAHMTGTHDFAGFAAQGSPRSSTVRTVRRVGIRRRYSELLIDVEGDGFLYNQVRAMVGTLVEIGRGHWPPERVLEILETRDRGLAGPTAPARGLCLQWVRYDHQQEPPNGP